MQMSTATIDTGALNVGRSTISSGST